MERKARRGREGRSGRGTPSLPSCTPGIKSQAFSGPPTVKARGPQIGEKVAAEILAASHSP